MSLPLGIAVLGSLQYLEDKKNSLIETSKEKKTMSLTFKTEAAFEKWVRENKISVVDTTVVNTPNTEKTVTVEYSKVDNTTEWLVLGSVVALGLGAFFSYVVALFGS